MASDPQTDSIRWVACTGCNGELGIPSSWSEPAAKCPNCGRDVGIDTVPQVLWRPKPSVTTNSQREENAVATQPQNSTTSVPPTRTTSEDPSTGSGFRPRADSAQPMTNGLAVTGLCLGIASVFLAFIGIIPILAIIFSGLGLAKAHARGGAGQVQAWIGLVLGIVFTLVYLNMYGHIR